MRIQIKHLLICSAFIVLCGFVLSYGTLSQSEAGNSTSNNDSDSDEIVKLYQELITLRQKAVEEYRRRWEYGTQNISGIIDLEIKAAEARIQLAQYQDKKETVIEELENLVKVMTELRNRIKREVDIGQRAQSDLNEFESSLLEVKIRLAKTK